MLITKEKFLEGLMIYAENEVIAPLPTIGKWGAGAVIVLAKSKLDRVVNSVDEMPIVKTLGIVNDDGLIDIDLLCSAVRESASRYGKLQFSYPALGTLTFSVEDIDKLREYYGGTNERRTENETERNTFG